MGSSLYSDYGSGSTSEKFSLWGSQGLWLPLQNRMQEAEKMKEKSASFSDVTAKRSIDEVLQEFRMNGSDSPYDPDEDAMNKRTGLMGLGPASVYLRQKSWPAPERSPVINLPQPLPSPAPCNDTVSSMSSSTLNVEQTEMLTPEQLRVLSTLPYAVIEFLLKSLQSRNGERGTSIQCKTEEIRGCAFCRSNGERSAWYLGHVLRSAGRLCCPVLRALVCRRCGAHGDNAHTLKYCPLATSDEREKSAAMMRSIRTASGRRRAKKLAPSNNATEYYVRFGEIPPSVIRDVNVYSKYEHPPLDPNWAALEKRLMFEKFF